MTTETIRIEGTDRVPPSAEEQINDAIHRILGEDHGISPDVVYWEANNQGTTERSDT